MRLSYIPFLVFSCLINVGLQLSDAQAQFYFGANEQIMVTDINGQEPMEFVDDEIRGIAVDTTNGLLFFSNVSSNFNQFIEKIDLTGNNREVILKDSQLDLNSIAPRGIALDTEAMRVYIADILNDGKIYSVSYDGTGAETLVEGEPDGVTKGILDLAVDQVNEKLYWVKLDAVMRSNLDGTNVEMVVEVDRIQGQEDNPVQPSVIQVDPEGGLIYWTDPNKNQITTAALDGSGKSLLINTFGSPEGLQLDLTNQKIYWLDDRRFSGEAFLFRADLDGSRSEEIAEYQTPTSNTGPMAMYKFEVATSLESENTAQPKRIKLNQNYPNPFNPVTKINFQIAESGQVHLDVYNTLGQKVSTLIQGEILSTGTYSYSFDASGFPSGIYYYRLSANGATLTRSMTLLK